MLDLRRGMGTRIMSGTNDHLHEQPVYGSTLVICSEYGCWAPRVLNSRWCNAHQSTESTTQKPVAPLGGAPADRNAEGHKRCPRCRQFYPLDGFHKSSRRAGWL